MRRVRWALVTATAGAAGALLLAACAARVSDGSDLLGSTSFGADAAVNVAELERHPRGFYFREVSAGDGPAAAPGRRVYVSYVVRLADGREVDRAEPEEPVTFRLGDAGVIPALDAALRGMKAGGTRQLVVPPRLGYGARGKGPVPPNAVLVMLVTLVHVDAR
jgi:FKBP-type peptidyl-prolyl cis-trans isomerase